MKAVIDFVCRAHGHANGSGPLITPVDGMWGYCEGHGTSGHEWKRIVPTAREHLGDVSQMQEGRAG
jgi:hypothetical protein